MASAMLVQASPVAVTSAFTNTVHRPMMEFRDSFTGPTRFLAMRVNGTAPNSFLVVQRFSTATNAATIATGTISIGDSLWHHIEFEFVASQTTGICKVWIDGVLDIDFSGVTSASVAPDITLFHGAMWAGACANAGGAHTRVDDMLVWDDSGTGFTGRLTDKHRIRSLLPGSNGDTVNFTPSAGSNFQNVDDATSDNDTTYNSGTAAAQVDLYNVGSLAFAPTTVYATQVQTLVRKDELRAVTARAKAKKSVTTVNGATASVYNGYRGLPRINMERDPTDNSVWNAAKISSLQIGVERVS